MTTSGTFYSAAQTDAQLAAQAASVAATYSHKGATLDIRDYGTVDMTGATDCSPAFLAALAATQAAGATLVIPPGTLRVDSQIALTNNGGAGIPLQNSIRITGAGQSRNMNSGPAGGTILDLRYAGATGKIISYGAGVLELDHLTLTDYGTSSTPFVYITCTILKAHHLTIVGNPTKGHATADQDVFVLGGGGTGYDGTVNSPFGGYGTVIENCAFDRIRRALWARTWSAVNFINNEINLHCGAVDGSAAAIDIDQATFGVGWVTDNLISGNYVELQGYVYGIAIRGGQRNMVTHNGFWDPTNGTTVASVYCTATASGNLIVSMGEGGTDFLEDTAGSNSYIGRDPTGGGIRTRGGWNFASTTKPMYVQSGIVVQGDGVSNWAPLHVQPAQSDIPTDTTSLLKVVRHASAATSPGGTAFAVSHGGTITAAQSGAMLSMLNGFVKNGDTLQRWTAGTLTLNPLTGGNVAISGTALFYSGKGATASRPTAFQGAQWFDTTLNKPIWYDGAKWVDAMGNAV